jgi:hypothetical protein
LLLVEEIFKTASIAVFIQIEKCLVNRRIEILHKDLYKKKILSNKILIIFNLNSNFVEEFLGNVIQHKSNKIVVSEFDEGLKFCSSLFSILIQSQY